MIEFMREGGWVMWVVLILVLITFGAAALFAYRPDERKLGFIRAMSTATILSVLSGLSTNMGAVFHHVPNNPDWSKEMGKWVIIGLGESLAPAILGFTLLSWAWLLVAVGIRRSRDGA